MREIRENRNLGGSGKESKKKKGAKKRKGGKQSKIRIKKRRSRKYTNLENTDKRETERRGKDKGYRK